MFSDDFNFRPLISKNKQCKTLRKRYCFTISETLIFISIIALCDKQEKLGSASVSQVKLSETLGINRDTISLAFRKFHELQLIHKEKTSDLCTYTLSSESISLLNLFNEVLPMMNDIMDNIVFRMKLMKKADSCHK